MVLGSVYLRSANDDNDAGDAVRLPRWPRTGKTLSETFSVRNVPTDICLHIYVYVYRICNIYRRIHTKTSRSSIVAGGIRACMSRKRACITKGTYYAFYVYVRTHRRTYYRHLLHTYHTHTHTHIHTHAMRWKHCGVLKSLPHSPSRDDDDEDNDENGHTQRNLW